GHAAHDHGPIAPVGWHEIAGLSPLLALIVLIGVCPAPFLAPIRSGISRLEEAVNAQQGAAARYVPPRDVKPGTVTGKRGGGASKKGGGDSKGKGSSAQSKGEASKSKSAQPAAKSVPPVEKSAPATKGGTTAPGNPSEKARS
ncbi:MAG: hypothetical protein ACLQIB_41005, partial [Isosphaeraceae bacterium]